MAELEQKLVVTLEDCHEFRGRYSLWPAQMFVALNRVTYSEQLRVCEFGTGIATLAVVRLLEAKSVPFTYVAYEHTGRQCDPKVSAVSWSRNDFPKELQGGVFDLVLLDTPVGPDRVKWLPLLKSHVRPGTILVFDDFDHYPLYRSMLRKHFDYKIVEHVNLGKQCGVGQCYVVCWLTAKIKATHAESAGDLYSV